MTFHAFVFLQGDAEEETLETLLLARGDLALVSTRSKGMASGRQSWDEPWGEAWYIAHEHPQKSYGEAWQPSMTPNTLKMLNKIAGVEWLRRQSKADHALIVRIRPDLELRAPLELPAPSGLDPRTVLAAWLCEAEQLLSDQLLLLTPSAAARLASLYEPSVLRATANASSPPTMYPERLVYHALRAAPAFELRSWPGARPFAGALIGGAAARTGEPAARDPFAKLRADYAPRPGGCAYPAWDAGVKEQK